MGGRAEEGGTEERDQVRSSLNTSASVTGSSPEPTLPLVIPAYLGNDAVVQACPKDIKAGGLDLPSPSSQQLLLFPLLSSFATLPPLLPSLLSLLVNPGLRVDERRSMVSVSFSACSTDLLMFVHQALPKSLRLGHRTSRAMHEELVFPSFLTKTLKYPQDRLPSATSPNTSYSGAVEAAVGRCPTVTRPAKKTGDAGSPIGGQEAAAVEKKGKQPTNPPRTSPDNPPRPPEPTVTPYHTFALRSYQDAASETFWQ
ncbi:hypothetical protein CVT26_012619 [Gymnopilus dilepis]|uniref:Uncharacterized protein n=1 Tax=Gymnopilus dilepis TaxID=231916 RepID=A0A409YW22_9AGAR|nr:hypothetical protein CVT26_012619 [Gymnopilus dilepis]